MNWYYYIAFVVPMVDGPRYNDCTLNLDWPLASEERLEVVKTMIRKRFELNKSTPLMLLNISLLRKERD
jgi:hypothetical protein